MVAHLLKVQIEYKSCFKYLPPTFHINCSFYLPPLIFREFLEGLEKSLPTLLYTSVDEHEGGDWKCNSCPATMTAQECKKKLFGLNMNIEAAVSDSQGSVQVMELLLNTR